MSKPALEKIDMRDGTARWNIKIPVDKKIIDYQKDYEKAKMRYGAEDAPLSQVAFWRILPLLSDRMSKSKDKPKANTKKMHIGTTQATWDEETQTMALSFVSKPKRSIISDLKRVLAGKPRNKNKTQKAVDKARRALLIAYRDALATKQFPDKIRVHPDDVGRLQEAMLVDSDTAICVPLETATRKFDNATFEFINTFAVFGLRLKEKVFPRSCKMVKTINKDWWKAACKNARTGRLPALAATLIEDPSVPVGTLKTKLRALSDHEAAHIAGTYDEDDEDVEDFSCSIIEGSVADYLKKIEDAKKG